MLKWFSKIIRDARIDMDFPRFEKSHHSRFVLDAYERYSCADMEGELTALKKKVQAEADAKFNADRDLLCREIGWLEPKVHRTRGLLYLLQRNFRAELDGMYEEKAAIYEERQRLTSAKAKAFDDLAELKSEKDDLHQERRRYQDEIESWYAEADRSPWLMGQKGREIPQHSYFKISHSSLEAAKSNRQEVFEKLSEVTASISDSHAQIGALKQRLQENRDSLEKVKQRILKAKSDRDECIRAKKEGNTLADLQAELDCYSQQMTKMLNAMNSLNSQREQFVVATESLYQVPALQQKIEALVEQRVAHLRAYDLPEQKAERIAMHRQQWLAAHSKT
ncbi:hypothetical protein [Pseudomonas knackmussii]|uniref:hypothetical protein n=1 Tax=Pseudomonas knackmussii TaxID=65741 RepID=UPI003F49C79F